MKLNRIAAILAVSSVVCSTNAAVYKVVEKNNTAPIKHTFARDINSQGNAVALGKTLFDFPIDLNSIDLDLAVFEGYAKLEDLKSGIVDNESMELLTSYLSSTAGSSSTQKMSAQYSVLFQDMGSELVSVFDTELSDGSNRLSRSTNEFYAALNDNNVSVGISTAPFVKSVFTTTPDDEATASEDITLWGREFGKRGFYRTNDNSYSIVPVFNEFGGESGINDISNSGYIVGYESIGFSASAQATLDATCDGKLSPLDVCFWGVTQSSSPFHTRAVRWKLDENNQVVERVQYGLVLTPDEDYTGTYNSQAFSVNDAGIAVGSSDSFREEGDRFFTTYPVVFRGEEVLDFVDHTDYRSGVATKINDNNIVVGYAAKFINGFERNKFFVYDLDADTIEFPEDFFLGAASRAVGINNNGLVVGDAEFETETGRVRRRHGFIYDINEKTFTDLNNYIACDSDYTIVQANAINDDNVILATAIHSVAARDLKGDLLLDESGNQVFEEVSAVVTLEAIPGGEPDNCENEILEEFERKGAAWTWPLLFIFAIRLFRKKQL